LNQEVSTVGRSYSQEQHVFWTRESQEAALYDVLYRDPTHAERLIAAGLDREAACELARSEASRRHAGRMFAAGSDLTPIGDVVLIVESKQRAA
jgi:hypothetical protein